METKRFLSSVQRERERALESYCQFPLDNIDNYDHIYKLKGDVSVITLQCIFVFL